MNFLVCAQHARLLANAHGNDVNENGRQVVQEEQRQEVNQSVWIVCVRHVPDRLNRWITNAILGGLLAKVTPCEGILFGRTIIINWDFTLEFTAEKLRENS